MSTHPPHKNYCHYYTGLDIETPVLNASKQRYINFDNAASTPAFKPVQDAVNSFLNYYSSVHRGTGFKSQLSTHVYEQARHTVLDFLGADPRHHTCIFVKNTTEAVNKLARRFPFTKERDLVLTSGMEHHSNDLPWRMAADVIHVGITPDGRLDEADYDRKLAQHGEHLALVAITAASNVTGFINPIHRLAEKAHAVGAQIMADCAQFAPHRKVDMRPISDPGHLDYITISGHKMYAPFGSGALVGRRETFAQGDPDYSGGGTVEIVTLDSVTWAGAPERDEAGSPNVVGAVALAAALRQLEQIGMQAVAAHEAELTAYLLERLATIPGLHIYGDASPETASDRLGSVPFNLEGRSHFLVAAILGHEFGIGVRNGCFCAHPYLLHLLGLTPEQAEDVRTRILAGDRAQMPGLIRISFGLYNTRAEIDALIEALQAIQAGNYQGKYIQDTSSGEYHLQGWQPEFDHYFAL